MLQARADSDRELNIVPLSDRDDNRRKRREAAMNKSKLGRCCWFICCFLVDCQVFVTTGKLVLPCLVPTVLSFTLLPIFYYLLSARVSLGEEQWRREGHAQLQVLVEPAEQEQIQTG